MWIIPIECHLSIELVHMSIRIPNVIILYKLRWLKLRRHNNLGEAGQIFKVDTPTGTRT